MKADPQMQLLVLDLAGVDAELLQIRHRLAHLPEDAEIAQLEQQLQTHRDEAVKAQIAAEDVKRETTRLEAEIATMTQREEKDGALLRDGNLPAKALTELQHELGSLSRRRGVLEDELLEVMEQAEAVSADELRAGAMVTHVEGQIAEVTERRGRTADQADKDLVDATDKRAALAAKIDAGLLAVYDRQVSAGKVGAGLLRQRRCGACRMELDRSELSSIASAAEDEVVRCDECGAILVRTKESGL